MDKLKQYRINILKIKSYSDFLLLAIPIIITVFLPILKTIIVGILNKNFDNLITQANIWYGLVLIVLLVFYYIAWFNTKNLEADRNYLDEEIIQFRDITNKYEKLVKLYENQCVYIDRAVSMTKAMEYTTKNLVSMLMYENITVKEFKGKISDTFSLILELYQNFYNKENERMTIALYYYCEKTKEFWEIESAKPKIFKDNFVKDKAKGRIWKDNDESHICYVARRRTEHEFVFDNINNELNKPLNTKKDDASNYVSSISIPLFDIQKEKVIGVFSITSNLVGRFNRSNKEKPIVSYLNRIFVDIFFDIARILEIIMNKYYSNINSKKQLELEILNDYLEHSKNDLSDYHEQLISNLHVEVQSNG